MIVFASRWTPPDQHSLQDVIRCQLCETPVPSQHCITCYFHVCIGCVDKHRSDESKRHRIVPFRMRGAFPKCQKHPEKICEEYCETCSVSICALCIDSGEHGQHDKEDILKFVANKKETMRKDLEEFEKIIYPQYEEARLNIPLQRNEAFRRYEEITTALTIHWRHWQRGLETVLGKMYFELFKMKSKHKEFFHDQEKNIGHALNLIVQIIQNLKLNLDTNDVCRLSEYQSRNAEFRQLRSKLEVSLPTFTPHQIDIEHIYDIFGFLKRMFFKTEDYQAISLLKKPQIIIEIMTGYEEYVFNSVSCLIDNEFWTCGDNEIIRLYNIHGQLLKSVRTITGKFPRDITVLLSGELVYTDYRDCNVLELVIGYVF